MPANASSPASCTGADLTAEPTRSLDCRVAICIATCRRPESLAGLLGALERLEVPDDTHVCIVVVDNDSQESARAVCREAELGSCHAFSYQVEKQQGIPFARNAALAAALPDSDFVAFIDDDEVPEPSWLAELLRVQTRYCADVVTGPCLPRYLDPPADWIVEGRFHDRPRHPTGTERPVAYTHNVLVRATVFDSLERCFDESMALHGGDDSELFGRVAEAGFSIIWADDAVVHECIPASRATLRWIVTRGFRVGTGSAWLDGRRSLGSGLAPAVHGVYCIAKGTLHALASPLLGRARAAQGLRLLAFGAGLIAGSLGHLHPEYRTIHGS